MTKINGKMASINMESLFSKKNKIDLVQSITLSNSADKTETMSSSNKKNSLNLT